jgi:hypothetical protein
MQRHYEQEKAQSWKRLLALGASDKTIRSLKAKLAHQYKIYHCQGEGKEKIRAMLTPLAQELKIEINLQFVETRTIRGVGTPVCTVLEAPTLFELFFI